MGMYYCYRCHKMCDSHGDEGAYASEIAKLREKGERQYECVCEECHEEELEELEEEKNAADRIKNKI